MSDRPRILFAGNAVPNCGMHQYGDAVMSALRASEKFLFEYAGIGSLADLDRAVGAAPCAAIIVNYHPGNLRFIDPVKRRYPVPCIAVLHDLTQARADGIVAGFFQYYVMADPTLHARNARVFTTGRIIRPYENRKPLPGVTTIGSFGFYHGSKGFERLVDLVQEEFDEAVIRMNIAPNGMTDRDGAYARRQADLCRKRLWKPGIRLEATHDFLDHAGLVDFLASNSLNALLYDYATEGAGISAAADQALEARRPLAITRSSMFRHLHDLQPPITVEGGSLGAIMRNGIAPYERLLQEWAPEKARARYEEILSKVLSGSPDAMSAAGGQDPRFWAAEGAANSFLVRAARGLWRRVVGRVLQPLKWSGRLAWTRLRMAAGLIRPRGGFNRILDDVARVELAAAIGRLRELAPAMFARKISRANVQQAFVFDAVQHFARGRSGPRMLCVGSFEDTAAEALKKSGYRIEEIDPGVNRLDLNSFCKLPTTKFGSYDVVFSTSVLEHVFDDERFVNQMARLLAPGGVGILTCDFKEGYRRGDLVVRGDHRFYTKADLLGRISGKLQDCELVDAPAWDCLDPDFELGGFAYTFATLTFRKRAA